MENANNMWPLVISLAAVVNGLGIVRLIGGLGEYLKKHTTLNVQHYWVYTLVIVFQLQAHLLLWWSILGLRASGNINFLSYMYLLIGPTLLYLGTSLVIPEIKEKYIDLRKEYYDFRKALFSILSVFWLWCILLWPVFGYSLSPTVPLLLIWFFTSVVLSVKDNPIVNAVLVVVNLLIYFVFIVMFAMQFGEVGRMVVASIAG